MITPPTEFFWLIRAEGEAAEYITSTLSVGAMNDIREVVLISKDYTNDIEATHRLASTVDFLMDNLPGATESIEMNPLYYPCTDDQLDLVMEGDPESDNAAFVGMDGNPFALKKVDIALGERNIMNGTVACKPFDLPSYSDILRAQESVRIN